MLFSVNLLKQWISIPSDYNDIKDKLIAKLFEIEHGEVSRILPDLVVIGKVTSVEKHPNADTLFVCQLDCGSHGNYQICTGGENVASGQFVPVALPGCYLPAINLEIGARKLRGLDSNGMICSKTELGINEDADQHWIWDMQKDLACDDSMIGKKFKDVFPWFENTIFEVESVAITNRPDLWGHVGLACECRSIFSDYLKSTDPINTTIDNIQQFTIASLESLPVYQSTTPSVDCSIQTSKCSYYSLTSIPNTTNTPSIFPGRVSLIDLGHIPRSSWIDYSNYFMSNYGQPIHIFDAETIKGSITIREANGGELFTDLTGKEHKLVAGDIIICDEDIILALGGIIGGNTSACSDTTKSILIEIANFDSIQIRKTATRLGLRTDAAARFEKEISPMRTAYCVWENHNTLSLNHEQHQTGAIAHITHIITSKQEEKTTIQLNLTQATEYIHGSFNPEIAEQIQPILKKLGYKVIASNTTETGSLDLIAPLRRSDVNTIQDIYEDLARHIGLETIPEIASPISINRSQANSLQFGYELAEKLISIAGCNQIETYPRYSEQWIKSLGLDIATHFELLNPTDTTTPYMAQTLLPGLLEVVKKNHRQVQPIKLFEIGKVYTQGVNKALETKMLAMIHCKKKDEKRNNDVFLEVKQSLQTIEHCFGLAPITFQSSSNPHFHPNKQAQVLCNNEIIGFIGELHPTFLEAQGFDGIYKIAYAAFELEKLFALRGSKENKPYESLQDQLVNRDLSFELETLSSFEKIIGVFMSSESVHHFEVIDLYRQDNSEIKSITINFEILGDGALTTEAINTHMNQIIIDVEKTGAKLKGARRE